MKLWSSALQSLLLGLSTGTYCAMYCAPILIPFISGSENNSLKKTTILTSLFLAGRIVSYVVLGIICAGAGMLVSSFFNPVFARRLSVFAYIICGLILLQNFLVKRKLSQNTLEANNKVCPVRKKIVVFTGNDFSTAVLSGLSVGLHICPPFWASLFLCAQSGSFFYASIIFLCFYIGTLPFFLPVLGLPFAVKKIPVFKQIAQMTQLFIAVYFIIFAGLIPLIF